jgi:hypothetical protein
MKKILILLSLTFCVCIYASKDLKVCQEAEAIAINGPLEDEFVKKVNALCVENDGKYYKYEREIYKKKNGNYYLYENFREYTLVKNTLKTYKGMNVSSYKYYTDCYYHRYFFNL